MYRREEGHISQWYKLMLGELRNLQTGDRMERGVIDTAPWKRTQEESQVVRSA